MLKRNRTSRVVGGENKTILYAVFCVHRTHARKLKQKQKRKNFIHVYLKLNGFVLFFNNIRTLGVCSLRMKNCEEQKKRKSCVSDHLTCFRIRIKE